MKKIVLASASPRRKALLRQIGLKFVVEPSVHEEDVGATADPYELVTRLAEEKARQAAQNHRNAVIIAADTIGVLDGKIIGKPHSEDEARKMLAALSGKMHLVITGFTIIDTETGKSLSRTVTTKVYINKLTPEEIDAYVKSGEPLDKAGAYAIQGLGAVIVDRIEGDYYNVVGLPLSALAEGLKEFGVRVV
ncbi:MAG: septum formation inhibitor Maf [Chloroflexi bacterium]|nr:septum formation inhibitor Maf [Chloroflexota bacterium]